MLKSTLDRIVRSHRNVTSSCSISISSISGVPKEKVDCVVMGAGVVGLAVARELALKGREVLVLKSAPTFSTSTSSRNNEVIHASIYYPTHSLKPKFCVRGRYLLYKYCSHHNYS
ncbi:hypothetical protein ACFXTI_014340 [Malus domestica]